MVFLLYLDLNQLGVVPKSGSNRGAHTRAEMAGQMLCALEAPGAMAARVVESVHEVTLCFMSDGGPDWRFFGGVVGVVADSGFSACIGIRLASSSQWGTDSAYSNGMRQALHAITGSIAESGPLRGFSHFMLDNDNGPYDDGGGCTEEQYVRPPTTPSL